MRAFSIYCTTVRFLSAAVGGVLAWAASTGSDPLFCLGGICACAAVAWVMHQLKGIE